MFSLTTEVTCYILRQLASATVSDTDVRSVPKLIVWHPPETMDMFQTTAACTSSGLSQQVFSSVQTNVEEVIANVWSDMEALLQYWGGCKERGSDTILMTTNHLSNVCIQMLCHQYHIHEFSNISVLSSTPSQVFVSLSSWCSPLPRPSTRVDVPNSSCSMH